MIQVSHCSVAYGEPGERVMVYENFNLSVSRGESLVLIGSSGCGKTTLLYVMAGLLKPTEGEVQIDGKTILGPRQETGFILQEYGLFPWLTVEENVSLGLRVRHLPRPANRSKVDAILREMGLLSVRRHYPSQLSGGQRQRVALARALTLDPDLLLMDEPLSALDALTRERLQLLLLEIWQRGGLTSVLVTHSIEEAVFLGQRILVLGANPASILAEVENPEAGSAGYRQTRLFYERCTQVRSHLEGGQT
ncbi:MAG: ABC transporter ATP-binding protein [Desulfitobacteriaceae bacterium]|nr:ABC transporter ATP-binding protein [Desulfitobacteriaceae bacterium]MDI6880220.1 ABC transporter ATP-binding protein [Desulfitobacteriaceae bacterium]MDI6913076.1 ABC transporter ATP-binding protein [Desulfitobacteriaceae bacterium]